MAIFSSTVPHSTVDSVGYPVAWNTESIDLVLNQYFGNETSDSRFPGPCGQTMEQHRGYPVMRKGIGHHECNLCLGRIIQPVVAPDCDELAISFHHQGRAVSTIHLRQVCNLCRLQYKVRVEVPQHDGAVRETPMEPNQRFGVVRSDRADHCHGPIAELEELTNRRCAHRSHRPHCDRVQSER